MSKRWGFLESKFDNDSCDNFFLSLVTEEQDMRGTKSMSDLDRIMYERKPKTHSSGDITEQMVNTLQVSN